MLQVGPEICHVDRCPHGCTSETGCKGIEGRRLVEDEAARTAFEADAKRRYPDVPLRAMRKETGYINLVWDADWQLWRRAWNAARGVPSEPDLLEYHEIAAIVAEVQAKYPNAQQAAHYAADRAQRAVLARNAGVEGRKP